MRAHIVDNGVVVNTIIVDSLDDLPGLIDGEIGGIGWTYANGVLSPPDTVDQPPTLEDYDRALTEHLDAVAQSRRWQDRISLMSRAGFPGPWQADAIAFGQWADGCNVIGYQMLADFQAGNIPQPSVEDVIAALPPMVWPT